MRPSRGRLSHHQESHPSPELLGRQRDLPNELGSDLRTQSNQKINQPTHRFEHGPFGDERVIRKELDQDGQNAQLERFPLRRFSCPVSTVNGPVVLGRTYRNSNRHCR